MRGSITKLLCIGLLSAGSLFTATAQETSTNKTPPTAQAPKSARHLPFRGTIASVDKAGKSITLLGEAHQVIHITSQTKITKGTQNAKFEDLTVKTKVTGSKKEVAPEKWEATSLKIAEVAQENKK